MSMWRICNWQSKWFHCKFSLVLFLSCVTKWISNNTVQVFRPVTDDGSKKYTVCNMHVHNRLWMDPVLKLRPISKVFTDYTFHCKQDKIQHMHRVSTLESCHVILCRICLGNLGSFSSEETSIYLYHVCTAPPEESLLSNRCPRRQGVSGKRDTLRRPQVARAMLSGCLA